MTHWKTLEPLEYDEQVAFFEWAERTKHIIPELKHLYATLNGVWLPKQIAGRMKRAGHRKGVLDIVWPIARHGYHGLYIELKRRKSGRLSAAQKEEIEFLRAEGYCAGEVRGWEEAAKFIMKYIEG